MSSRSSLIDHQERVSQDAIDTRQETGGVGRPTCWLNQQERARHRERKSNDFSFTAAIRRCGSIPDRIQVWKSFSILNFGKTKISVLRMTVKIFSKIFSGAARVRKEASLPSLEGGGMVSPPRTPPLPLRKSSTQFPWLEIKELPYAASNSLYE